jgi:Protein of Unknown function (DUF2784)
MRIFAVLSIAVLVVHVAWIVWVLFGWLLTRHRLWLRWVHLASLIWGIVVEVGPWPCPLTLLEQWLDRLAGLASYRGSFIYHYLEAFIYPDVPPLLLTWFGPVLCAVILAIEVSWFWRDRRTMEGRA